MLKIKKTLVAAAALGLLVGNQADALMVCRVSNAYSVISVVGQFLEGRIGACQISDLLQGYRGRLLKYPVIETMESEKVLIKEGTCHDSEDKAKEEIVFETKKYLLERGEDAIKAETIAQKHFSPVNADRVVQKMEIEDSEKAIKSTFNVELAKETDLAAAKTYLTQKVSKQGEEVFSEKKIEDSNQGRAALSRELNAQLLEKVGERNIESGKFGKAALALAAARENVGVCMSHPSCQKRYQGEPVYCIMALAEAVK